MCSLTSFIREPTFNNAQVVWYSMKVSLENSGWFSALSPTKKPILLLLKKNKMLITSGQVFGKTPGYAKNRNCFLCSEKMVIYRNVIFYLCFALDSPWPLIFPICLCPHTTKGKQIVIAVPVSYLQLVYRILADPAKQIWDTFMDKPWLTQSE